MGTTMTPFIKKLTILLTSLTISLSAFAYQRVVTITPDVADIMVALGDANKVVGKDTTNKTPALKHAAVVGMHRNITPEAIVATQPDLVLGSYMAQPSSIFQRLNQLNIEAINVAPNEKVATYASSIVKIGKLMGKPMAAQRMADEWLSGMNTRPATKKRYLLSYDGRIVAGKGTVADELIRRAGGINAANVKGFVPMSREGWLAAKADVIIIADHHKATLGSLEQYKQRPEIAINPAAKNNNIQFWPANDFLRYGLDSPAVIDKLNKLAK